MLYSMLILCFLRHYCYLLLLYFIYHFSAQYEDGQLCTSAMRELEKAQNQLNLLHKYKKCIVRIHFPNRLVLQSVFKSTETVLDIINFIRKYLVDESLNFSLCKHIVLI